MRIQPGNKYEMIYLDSNKKITQRIIKVIKVNEDLILAYCYTKKKVRTFKLENILSVGPTRKRMGA